MTLPTNSEFKEMKMPLPLFQHLLALRFKKLDDQGKEHALSYTFIREGNSIALLVRSITTKLPLCRVPNIPVPTLGIRSGELIEGIDLIWDTVRLKAAEMGVMHARDKLQELGLDEDNEKGTL